MTAMLESCLKKMEANPEETGTIAERQKVPNEEAAEEMIRALKDRSGEQRLAIRRRGQLTRCAVSARNKGPQHTGLMVKKRQWTSPECNNNIRN
jgi:hypothetical protein